MLPNKVNKADTAKHGKASIAIRCASSRVGNCCAALRAGRPRQGSDCSSCCFRKAMEPGVPEHLGQSIVVDSVGFWSFYWYHISSVQASGCRIFFTHKKYFQCVKPVVRFLQIHPKHPKKGNVAKHRVTQNSFHVLLPVDWPRALINVVFALHLVVIRAENGRKLAEPPS